VAAAKSHAQLIMCRLLFTCTYAMPIEAPPAGPAKRKTPVWSFLLGSVSVGATSSRREEGALSNAEAATSDKYCRSASGLWKEPTPPAFSCGQDA